jgi:hypothetical protein
MRTNYTSQLIAVFLTVTWLFFNSSIIAQGEKEHIISAKNGSIHFISNAPLELIEATSNDFRAVIDTVSGKFAFSVPMLSFLGFNSELQRTHFNENYLESKRYPNATFAGKMIEKWAPPTEQSRLVRAKGPFTVHGVTKERLIPAEISREGNAYRVKATFVVVLEEHNIKVPKLVAQKIASEITVTVNAVF